MSPEAMVRERLDLLLGGKAPMSAATFTGRDLLAARRVLGLTQAEASQVCDCHINTWANAENDKTYPRRGRVRRAMREFIEQAQSVIAHDSEEPK